jgi:hypothetical protein
MSIIPPELVIWLHGESKGGDDLVEVALGGSSDATGPALGSLSSQRLLHHQHGTTLLTDHMKSVRQAGRVRLRVGSGRAIGSPFGFYPF